MAEPTRDQLIAALRKADAANDTEAAKAIARRIQSADTAPKPAKKSWLETEWDAAKNTLGGIVEGVGSIPDAGAQFVGQILAKPFQDTQRTPEQSRKVKASGPVNNAIETVRKWTAAPLAWVPGADKIAQSFRNPVTIGGLAREYLPKPDAPGASVARFGANMLGGAMFSEIPAVKTAGGALMDSFGAKPVPKTGIPAPTVTNEIVDEGKKAGVRVLTTDVKPPKTFVGKIARNAGERIPFAGTGGVRAAQQTERVEAVKTLLRDFGGDDAASLYDDATGTLEDVAKSLTATRGKELSRLTSAKDAVIDGIQGNVDTPKAVTAIDDQISKLKSIGAPELDSVIGKLEGWKQSLSGGKPLRTVEELRKIMGEAFNDPGLAAVKTVGQKAVNAIYGPLREDMGDFIKAADPASFAKWSNANTRLASMANELDATTFKSVLKSADATPESVGRLLFSKNASDVSRLVSNLDPAGRAKAQAALLQRAFDKSISADKGLSVERFINNLDALGKPVGVVFKGADLARVKGLTKVLDATRRAAESAAAPATGVQNAPAVGGFALGTLFGQAAIPAAGIGGLFARAYESAPVRDLLLKLGQSKAGSPAEQLVMRRLSGALAAIVRRDPEATKLPAYLNENVPASAVASDKGAPPKTVMGYEAASNPDRSQWDKRPDGSAKGDGFLGALKRPDGSVSTEISVGVNIGGKETEIPLMVPGLTKSELDYLMTRDPESPDFQRSMPPAILDKAVAHARDRISRGLSPFK